MIGVVVFLRLLIADLRRAERVLRLGERLRLGEVGLDAREDVAAANLIAVAMKNLGHLPGNRALHIHLHLGLHGPDFRHLDLNVGDFGLPRFDRVLHFVFAASRLHRDKDGDDGDGQRNQ